MITIQFKDLDEMKRFARELLGAEIKDDSIPVQNSVPAPVMPTAPVQTVTQTETASAPVTPVPIAPVSQSQPAAPVQSTAVPTSAHTYTRDDLARAAITLMDSGKQDDLIGLLSQFGVDSLPALQESQFGAFATALRGMGAQI